MTEISFIYKKNDYQYLKMNTVIFNDESIEIDKDQKYENIVIDKKNNFKGLTIGVDDISRSKNYINLNPDNLSLKELYYSIFQKKWNIPKNDIERRLNVLVKIFNQMISDKVKYGNILENLNLSEIENTDDEELKEDVVAIENLDKDINELKAIIKKEMTENLKEFIEEEISEKLEEKIIQISKNERNYFNFTLFFSNILVSIGIVIYYDLYKFEI